MTSPTTVLRLLARWPRPRVIDADRRRWGPETCHLLERQGFLVPGILAEQAVCPVCDGLHRFWRRARDPIRAHAACPCAGDVAVPLSDLQEWTLDYPACAAWVGQQLGARRPPVEVLPQQAWRWDRLTIAHARHRLLLVRSATLLATTAAWSRLGCSPRTVLLAMEGVPAPPAGAPPIAHAAPLWAYVDDEHGLTMATTDLARDVAASDAANGRRRRVPGPDRLSRQHVLRRMHREVTEHLRVAQVVQRAGLACPPRPPLRHLARVAGTSLGTVHRCLTTDTSPAGIALRQSWAMAADPGAGCADYRAPPAPGR